MSACYVIILVQCNLFMIFQSITVNICCYDKSPKFERKVNDLYTTQGQIIKIVWNIPLIQYTKLLKNTLDSVLLNTVEDFLKFLSQNYPCVKL